MASTKTNEKIQTFFEQNYNITFSEEQLEEIHLSLLFLARAIHRYQLIQKGVIKNEK
jgi:hypothetical protein